MKQWKKKRLSKILKAIIKHDPPEVCYDEFSFNRLKANYRAAATEALDLLESKGKRKESDHVGTDKGV